MVHEAAQKCRRDDEPTAVTARYLIDVHAQVCLWRSPDACSRGGLPAQAEMPLHPQGRIEVAGVVAQRADGAARHGR